jgi:hypothetical protein
VSLHDLFIITKYSDQSVISISNNSSHFKNLSVVFWTILSIRLLYINLAFLLDTIFYFVLNKENIFLGCKDESLLLNLLIILTKNYIYKCKLNEAKPYTIELKNKIKKYQSFWSVILDNLIYKTSVYKFSFFIDTIFFNKSISCIKMNIYIGHNITYLSIKYYPDYLIW